MNSTYLVEITDDARTGKIVLPMQKTEIQRPAVEFVFDVLGAEPEQLASDRHLQPDDTRLLAHLRDMIFVQDGQVLVIKDGVEFEANRSPLDPDAPLEEYFLPRPDRPGDVYICELEVQSADPERHRRRQMLAYQAMFALGRFKRGYQTTMIDVDTLRPVTDAAEAKGLLKFDLAKSTFVLTAQGEKVYQSLVTEAQELISRYDLYADVLTSRSGGPARFQTGQGEDLRVPIWELNGINPFRARFVLGLNDGEWDDLADWPRKITSPRWFDEIFAPIEQAPTLEQLGRERCERIFDAGKDELAGTNAAPTYAHQTVYEYDQPAGLGYRDPFFDRSLWWLMFLL